MFGPLSLKQRREHMKFLGQQKREDQKMANEESRKDALFDVKLKGEVAKTAQSLQHKEQSQADKLGIPPPKKPKGLPSTNPFAGADYFGQGHHDPLHPIGKTDTVPAMLTPGEAVIPKAAAQNPKNKPAIKRMVQEGRMGFADGTDSVPRPKSFYDDQIDQEVARRRAAASAQATPQQQSMVQKAGDAVSEFVKSVTPTSIWASTNKKRETTAGYARGTTGVSQPTPLGLNRRIHMPGMATMMGFAGGTTNVSGPGIDNMDSMDPATTGVQGFEDGTEDVMGNFIDSQMPQEVVSGAPPVTDPRVGINPYLVNTAPVITAPVPVKAATEVPWQYSDKYQNMVVGNESNGKLMAKNPKSSAQGLGQFTQDTWNSLRGYNPNSIYGSVEFASPEFFTKENQLAAMKDLTNSNAALMRKAGYPVNDVTMYASHILGDPTMKKLMAASDDTPMSSVASAKAVESNPDIMKGKTVGDFKRWVESKVTGSPTNRDLLIAKQNLAYSTNPDVREKAKAIIASADSGNLPSFWKSGTVPPLGNQSDTAVPPVDKQKDIELTRPTPEQTDGKIVVPLALKDRHDSIGMLAGENLDTIKNEVEAMKVSQLPDTEKQIGLADKLKGIFSSLVGDKGIFTSRDLAKFAITAAGGMLFGGSTKGSLRYAGLQTLKDADEREKYDQQNSLLDTKNKQQLKLEGLKEQSKIAQAKIAEIAKQNGETHRAQLSHLNTLQTDYYKGYEDAAGTPYQAQADSFIAKQLADINARADKMSPSQLLAAHSGMYQMANQIIRTGGKASTKGTTQFYLQGEDTPRNGQEARDGNMIYTNDKGERVVAGPNDWIAGHIYDSSKKSFMDTANARLRDTLTTNFQKAGIKDSDKLAHTRSSAASERMWYAMRNMKLNPSDRAQVADTVTNWLSQPDNIKKMQDNGWSQGTIDNLVYGHALLSLDNVANKYYTVATRNGKGEMPDVESLSAYSKRIMDVSKQEKISFHAAADKKQKEWGTLPPEDRAKYTTLGANNQNKMSGLMYWASLGFPEPKKQSK